MQLVSKDQWEHYNPTVIHYGHGCRETLAEVLTNKRVLVVCSKRGRSQFEADHLLSHLPDSVSSLHWMDSVEANPDICQIQYQVDHLRALNLDSIVAFGGGSAIDSAKAFALALAPANSNRSIRDLITAAGRLPSGLALPLYALPTTGGTGSEVTPYATVWDHREKQKLSIFGPSVYPHSALVDPELCQSVPYDVTLTVGLDAINQALESIWNCRSTPLSEMFAQRALQCGIYALPRLLKDLSNQNLRDMMTQASLLSGLAISQTRTSICHSISYPLTMHFNIPHGLACAFTMPAVLRQSLRVDDGRFRRLSRVLSPSGLESTEQLFNQISELNKQLHVSESVRIRVGSWESLISLRDQMFYSGRADNALIKFDEFSLTRILEDSWSCL
jgi:phosphonate metabolism-associated iron-containing alcohol dehydrogenase